MKSRDYTDADHRMVAAWWEMQGWSVIPQDALPKTGVIVESDDKTGICAGFLYKTDSNVCLLEFIVANPLSDTMERGQALDLLIEELVERAKQMEFVTVFTMATNARLIDRYQSHKFQVTDRGMTHFVRHVWQ